MDTALLTTIVSTGGAVITGIFGMFFTANQLGKRIDDMGKRFDDLRSDMKELRTEVKELRSEFHAFKEEFYAFKEMVNGKFQALDFEIAKLMDRRNP